MHENQRMPQIERESKLNPRRVLTFATVLFSLVFLVLGVTAKANAATYYVDSVGGLDTYNGLSTSTPWKTLTKVNAATFLPGDSILFLSGDTFNGNLVVAASGTSVSYITFSSYGSGNAPIINAVGYIHGLDVRNGKAYLNFNNLVVQGATNEQVFLYNSVSYLNFSNISLIATGTALGFNINTGTSTNITISNSTSTVQNGYPLATYTGSLSNLTLNNFVATTSLASSTAGAGINITDNFSNVSITNAVANNFGSGINIGGIGSIGSGVTINNVIVSNNAQSGIGFAGTVSNVSLNGVTAFYNGGSGILFGGNGSSTASNVVVSSSTLDYNGVSGLIYQFNGTNATTANVTAAYNLNDGFDVHNMWANVTFDSCVADTNGVDGLGSDGDGFSFHETTTGTIIRSIAKNNKKIAIVHINNAQVTMIDNLFYNTTIGTQPLASLLNNGTYALYNNVIYSDGQLGFGFSNGGPTSTVEDNIIDGFSTGFQVTSGSVANDYNIVVNAASSTYSGVAAGSHSISLNPLFNNAPSRDFTLQYNSPAIDAGVSISGITTDILGNPIYGTPDIGPYEYQPPYTMGTDKADIGGGAKEFTATASSGLSAPPQEIWRTSS